ncbi:MAG: hypothetical protein WCO96_06855 [Actinomycetes bacterium]
MKSKSISRIALAASAAAALALPAGASAHSSVWQTTAKVPGTVVNGVVPTTDRVSYAITNHGYTMVLNETNGQTANGMMNYKVLPSAYRNQAGFTLARLLSEGDTGAQPHATCRGNSGAVTTLWTPEAIAAWQSQTPTTPAGAEPFYNYVPFQKIAAGLDDEAKIADWVAVVKDKTGVDLAATSDFAAACSGIGGTYVAADTVGTTTASLNSGYAALVAGPLNTQIAYLGTQATGLLANVATLTTARDDAISSLLAANAAKDAALADLAAANTAKGAALAEVANLSRSLGASTSSASIRVRTAGTTGLPVLVSGPGGRQVTVTLTIGATQAKGLKLASTVIGTATGTIAAGGSSSITAPLIGAAKAKIKAIKANLGVTITVTSGDRIAVRRTLFTP